MSDENIIKHNYIKFINKIFNYKLCISVVIYLILM